MCRRRVFFPLFVWFGSFGSAAEPAVPPLPATFTLAQAVLQTLEKSPAVLVQREVIDAREGRREQASGAFDWYATAGLTQDRVRTPLIDPLGRPVVSAADTTTYSAGVSRELRNGVVLRPVAGVVVADRHSPGVPVSAASSVRLEILVPLLRGLGTESVAAAEAAARGDADVARLLYRHTLASRAFATVSAYWAARAATESFAVQRDVEERAVRLHDSIRVLVDSRVFAPIFLIQAEANRRDKGTQRRNAELGETTARFNLGRALGLPPEQMAATPRPGDAIPDASATYEQLAETAVRDRAIQRALAARADFLASRQSQRPLGLLARQAELDLRPRADLSLATGYQGFDPSRNPLAPLHERATGGNATVGVKFDWPSRNTYQRGLLRERRANVRQAEADTAQLASDIAADVLTVLEEVRLRAQTALTAAATVETALRAVNGQQERLRSGESTVLDVINLENLATSARLGLIEARAGYAIAVARLRYVLGAIFAADSTDRSFTLQDLTTPPSPDEK